MRIKFFILFLILLNLLFLSIFAEKEESDKPVYRFTIEKQVEATPVKNQARTGTCWSFAAISFLESEIMRETGIKDIDLSEMYIVRHIYPRKALYYVRLHGRTNFSSGGQGHDVLDQIRLTGIVPESVYNGKRIGEKKHDHSEMATILKGFMKGVVRKRGRRLSPRWMEALNAILDVYLGKPIQKFTFKGKTFTPMQFATDYLKLKLDDYVELTSCTNVPFYTKFRQLIPDNWTANGDYYNIPIDELETVIDNAIRNGYSVCWDADVSDRYFNYKKKGWAVVPEKDYEELNRNEKDQKIKTPFKEKHISQELRQKDYDNYTSTDDHLMHLIGIARDQDQRKFYLIKNSWGTDSEFKGYYYVSASYLRLRTINILINRKALGSKLRKKLKI